MRSNIHAINAQKETTGIIPGHGTGVCPNQVLPGLETSATQLAPHILCSIGEDFYTSYSEDEHATTSPVCQLGLKLLM